MNKDMNETKIKKKNIYIACIAIVSALYIVLVILIPVAWEIPQVRFADALFATVFFFGYPGAIGLAVGCVFANIIGGLGPIDIIFGSLANLLAGILGYYLFRKIKDIQGRRKQIYVQLILLLMNIINTAIVGTYLPYLLGMPYSITYLGIFLGSLISMNICGYILYVSLDKLDIETMIQ